MMDLLASPPGPLALPVSPNRQESPVLPAGLTDEEIVARWLRLKAAGGGALSKRTQAQYRLEAERLFWYAHRIEAPISTWTVDHLVDYLAVLLRPAPWAIGTRGTPRGSPHWRPFLGPLSDRSAAQTQHCYILICLAARRGLTRLLDGRCYSSAQFHVQADCTDAIFV
jgi:hypothetical protein